MKLTYGKSEPWNSGWRGWSDVVDIFLDSEKIGTLEAHECTRRYLEYFIVSDHPKLKGYRIGHYGLKASKLHVQNLLAKPSGEL